MPLSEIQNKVLRLIAANRSPDSYLAGATVLHRAADSARFSQDLDLFHDIEDLVVQSAEKDADTLRQAGYTFTWLLQTPAFCRAVVETAKQKLKLEWAQDSAFRFFPVQEDECCGYRLHDVDAACNKLLALAGRNEVRDFVDILQLDKDYLSLGTLSWAACGKDPGFTPDFLLDHVSRHTAYTQADLNRLHLREPIDLIALKKRWFKAMDEARDLVAGLPPAEIGCLYLDANRQPVNPEPKSESFITLIRHRGCAGGAWPTVCLHKSSNE